MSIRSIPTFRTKRLEVRPLVRADREDVYRNWLDRAVTVWFLREPITVIAQVDEILGEYLSQMDDGSGAVWALLPTHQQQVIGTIGYESWSDAGSGEIGFDLARAWWGRGLMAEALAPVIGFGFEALRLREVVAHTDPANDRAIGLLRGLGFRDDGILDDSRHFVMPAEGWGGGNRS